MNISKTLSYQKSFTCLLLREFSKIFSSRNTWHRKNSPHVVVQLKKKNNTKKQDQEASNAVISQNITWDSDKPAVGGPFILRTGLSAWKPQVGCKCRVGCLWFFYICWFSYDNQGMLLFNLTKQTKSTDFVHISSVLFALSQSIWQITRAGKKQWHFL